VDKIQLPITDYQRSPVNSSLGYLKQQLSVRKSQNKSQIKQHMRNSGNQDQMLIGAEKLNETVRSDEFLQNKLYT
jgi:hypothetical protein